MAVRDVLPSLDLSKAHEAGLLQLSLSLQPFEACRWAKMPSGRANFSSGSSHSFSLLLPATSFSHLMLSQLLAILPASTWCHLFWGALLDLCTGLSSFSSLFHWDSGAFGAQHLSLGGNRTYLVTCPAPFLPACSPRV